MNWIDGIIIFIVVFNAIEAYRRGFVLGSLDLLSFICSFGLSLSYYSILATFLREHFGVPYALSMVGGFFLLSLVFQFLFSYLFSFVLIFVPKQFLKSSANRVLGLLPGLLTTLLIISFLATLILVLPIRPGVKQSVTHSFVLSRLIPIVEWFETYIHVTLGTSKEGTLSFLTLPQPHDSKERIALNFTQKDHTVDVASEQLLVELLNGERTKKGLSPLVVDEALQTLARSYATDMFERGYFSHYSPEGTSPFDRMDAAKIIYITAGENLALAPTISIAHTGLMNSPTHRDNILSKEFGKVGVGVVDGGVYGKMTVEEFSN